MEVISEISIEKPLNDVVSFVSDPNNAPLWYNNIKLVEWKTPPPLSVGSEIVFVATFMGEVPFTYKVTDLGERSFEMKSEIDGFLSVTRYDLAQVTEDRTRMILRNISYPTGLSRLLSPVKSFMLKRSNMQDLERLKRILENS